MKRRDFLKLPAALSLTSLALHCRSASPQGYDVVVVGAGVFGIWTAFSLQGTGRRVAVIDAVSPAHSQASSGGESRVSRCGYGGEELYADWALRSMAAWRSLSVRAALPLFHETGVLWIHSQGDAFLEANAKTLTKLEIPFSRWSAQELRARYPVLNVADDEAGFYEEWGGGVMARRAVQQLAAELESKGVDFVRGRVLPIHAADGLSGALPSVETSQGSRIEAERFVFACGPWLDRVCPEAMAGRLFLTRQEVFCFAVDPALVGDLPVWADLPFYGLPSLEGRGFKVANDTHGPHVEMATNDRHPSREGEADAREFLSRRFPSLAAAPLSEARVCQYENSSNGDFVLDRHPGLDNVWIAGCGSGHGFKHGPAVGAYLTGLILGTQQSIPRFSLSSKEQRQDRQIQ